MTDTAGASRGAILHHFPNKVDLMIGAAEYAAEKQNRHVARLLAASPDSGLNQLARSGCPFLLVEPSRCF